jgi:uncharacterized membrane protein
MKKNQESKLSITLTKFFLPFAIAGLVIFILYLLIDSKSSGKLFFLMFAYFFPPLGKESIIPIGVSGGELTIPIINHHIVVQAINPLVMALTIAFVDIIVALFLLWNYDLAKKIPLIGKFMIKVENIGKSSSDKYSWIKPLRFIGIILFVMVPFQGSGGLVGSIIGRLIGMKPWNTFFAITIGAVVGTILIAYFSEAILSVFVKNFLLGILIIIIIIVIGFMVLIYKRSKNYNKSR